MAYVKLTTALRTHIESQASYLFNNRLEQNQKEIAHAFDAQQLLDAFISSDVKHRLSQVPKEYLMWQESFTVNLFGFKHTAHFTKQPIPLTWTSMGWTRHREWEERLDIPCIATLKTLADKEQVITQEKNALQYKVKKLLEAATSLQQVHEHWPTVLDLVPDEIRERFNAVYSRREATQAVKKDLSELFSNEMKTSLIKATMLKDAT